MLRNNINLTISSWLIWRGKTLQNNWTYSRCSNEWLIPLHAHSHTHAHTLAHAHTHVHTHTHAHAHTPPTKLAHTCSKLKNPTLQIALSRFPFFLLQSSSFESRHHFEGLRAQVSSTSEYSKIFFTLLFSQIPSEPLLWLLVDLTTQPILGGRHSTVVAFSLHTQPSRVRIWLLEKSNREEKCFFREPAVLKFLDVSALRKSQKHVCMVWWVPHLAK